MSARLTATPFYRDPAAALRWLDGSNQEGSGPPGDRESIAVVREALLRWSSEETGG